MTVRSIRRFLRFSLRGFLVVIVLVCIALGWTVERVRRQKRAVAWVQHLGGSVTFATNSNVPDWSQQSMVSDFFRSVVEVNFDDTQVADLTPVTAFRNLKSLRLVDTRVVTFLHSLSY